MSKWIDKELFNEFQKEKTEEKDNEGFSRSALLWQTPEKGTTENPKVYEGRFVPDKNKKFYKRFYYHMWQSGDESWNFILCPKTHDWKNFCPVCAATQKLFKGDDADKKQAYQLKRKEKFVGNWFVVKDPRDADKEDESKVSGSLRLYEFPSKLEQKLKKEITDKKEGYGFEIFDPSEDGRNFMIRVLATKKDKYGKSWPDYSNSSFSRSRSAIADSDEAIEAIMEKTVDIEDYVANMAVANEKVVEILKNEFLWDLVMDESVNNGYEDDGSRPEVKKAKKEPKKEPKKDEDEPKDEPKKDEDDGTPFKSDEEIAKETAKEEPKKEPKEEKKSDGKKDEIDPDDDALLKELENM